VCQSKLTLAGALQLEGVTAFGQLDHADPAHGFLLRNVLAVVFAGDP